MRTSPIITPEAPPVRSHRTSAIPESGSTRTTALERLVEHRAPIDVPTDSVDSPALNHLLRFLKAGASNSVTYDQIEAAMVANALDPTEAEETYEQLIHALERRGVRVIYQAPRRVGEYDEDAVAQDAADDVIAELNRVVQNIDAYRHPLLSAEQERRLLEIYHEGQRARNELERDPSPIQRRQAERRIDAAEQAFQELLRCNLRLVAKIALRFVRHARHLSFDDLIQEGRIGLMTAINRYDLNMGLRLSTYATWWVRQAISRAFADQDRTIRLPVHLIESLRRLRRASTDLSAELGREPTDVELAASVELPIEKVQRMRQQAYDLISLEMPVGEDGAGQFSDFIPAQELPMPSDSAELGTLRTQIADVLAQLTERERHVLQLRFGLEDGHSRTLEEIGRELGVTRERIRQIEVKALRKLRHPRLCKRLRDYLEA